MLAATALSASLQTHPKLEQAGQSFVCNVTINNYMPTLQWAAGADSATVTKQPMLISLLGPATWVWSTNCTNSLPDAANSSCASSPVGVNPAFNFSTMVLSDPAPTYLGLVSGGGYSSEATSVNISTPCLGGLINNPNLCFSGLEAVMAWNITADNWLINN